MTDSTDTAAPVSLGGLTYTAVTSLQWADSEQTMFNALVTFDHIGEVPFTCAASDTEAHAAEIYSRALAGDFGAIATYAAPAPTAATARAWRDAEITASQWLVERHRDQLAAGESTNLTADQYSALLAYRQALRDWPTAADFPSDASRPVAPDWLGAAEVA